MLFKTINHARNHYLKSFSETDKHVNKRTIQASLYTVLFTDRLNPAYLFWMKWIFVCTALSQTDGLYLLSQIKKSFGACTVFLTHRVYLYTSQRYVEKKNASVKCIWIIPLSIVICSNKQT